MTTIDRLGITGIRSYGPDHEQTITFTPPLTLILGSNGSGKTTIIEALRMATSGVLPPNSGSGQAFVHDPRVSHNASTETKAKIRLSFTKNGSKTTVARLFQLTNKKVNKVEKQQYKQFDGSIEIKEVDKEKQSISRKCADIDRIIPELMGVSQAVLQNVIFCHQEESNWILGEPKVLKDKFDAIFASTRYSKALDQVKKTQQELKLDIKDRERDEAEQKVLKEQAHQTTQTLRRCEHQKNEAQTTKLKAEEKIKDLECKLRRCNEGLETWHKAAEFEKECDRNIKWCEETRDKLDEKIPERLSDSTEELRKTRRDIETALQDANSAKRRDIQEVERLKAEKDDCSKALSALEEKHNKAQLQKEFMKAQVSERKKLAEKVADDFDLDKNLVPVQFETAPSTFYRELKNKFKSKEWDADKRKNDNTRALERLQEELSAVQQQEQREEQAVHHTRELITSKSKELAKVQDAISLLSFDKDVLVKLEEKVAEIKKLAEDELTKKPEDIQSDIDAMKASLKSKIEAQNKVKELLQSERIVVEKMAVVDNKRKDLEQRKKAIAQAMVQDRAVEELLGYKPTLDEIHSLSDTVKREMQSRRSELEAAKQKRMKFKAELEQKETTLKAKKAERDELNKQVSALIEEARGMKASGEVVEGLQEAVEGAGSAGTSFDELISRLEQKISKKAKQKQFAASMKQVAGGFEQQANLDKCCPLCSACLQDDARMREFMEKLSELANDADVDDAEKKAEESIARFKAHIAAVNHARAKTVKSGELGVKAQTVGEEEDRLYGDICQMRKAEGDAAAEESMKTDLVDKVEHVDDLLRQLNIDGLDQLEKSIKSDEVELSKLSVDQRGIETYEKKRRELEEQIENLNNDIDKLKNEKDRIMETKYKRERELADAKERANNEKRKMESHDENAKRKIDLENEIKKLREDNQKRKDEIPDVQSKICECKEKLSLQKRDYEANDRRSDLEINDMRQAMMQLKTLEEKIAEFKQKKLEEEEARMRQTIERDRKTLDNIDEQYAAAKAKLQNKGDDSHMNEKLLSEIDHNLEIREYESKIEDLEKKKKERLEQLEALPEKRELADLCTKYQKELDATMENLNISRGVIQSKEEEIQGHAKTLKDKKFAGIDKKYKRTQIAIETHKGAIKDLDKYYAALDKALMQFHTMKMEEINKYVKEYWQTTYKGDDIEAIEIKADLENTANRRSHNYRLVMHHKHLQVLDMRGRCSAGQKVLASLVVRLALAETFCHNCGVLALDEPTSNLDERNIKGFTEALGRIVNDRKQARNSGFQLIVISHDNEFIDDLARLTEVPEYFRIKKDPQSQYSKISVHDVNDF